MAPESPCVVNGQGMSETDDPETTEPEATSEDEAEATPPSEDAPASSDAEAASPENVSDTAGSAAPPPAVSDLDNRWGILARSVTLGGVIGLALVAWAQFTFKATWVTRFLTHNDIAMPQRMRMIASLGVGLVVGAAAVFVAIFLLERRGVVRSTVERWLWFASPLILAPALPQLYRWKPWQGKHETLLPLLLAVTLVAEMLFVHSFRAMPDRVSRLIERVRKALPEVWRKHGPLIVVVAGTIFYIAFMSFYNLRWHYKLRTHNFDLSIDNNLIYSALKGGHMESTVTMGKDPGKYLAIHAKLGQYVILPIYALYPKPETLIVIQSALLGLGALPLFGFAKRHVRPWVAAAVAIAYLCYYPMHSANFCESKYLSLSGFFVLAVYWAVETRRWVPLVLAFICASLMREDVPVGLAIGGTFLVLTGHRPLPGIVMAAVSTVWFLILRLLIMDKAGDWWFPSMYKGLFSPGQEGFVSVAKTLISNPLFTLDKILTKDKFFYLMHLLVPIAFLPVRRWYLWVALIPGALLTMLVTDYKPIFGFSFQYVMHWVPYLFLAVPLALSAIEKENGVARMRGALAALALAVSVSSYNYGAFSARDHSVRGGYFDIEFGFSQKEKDRLADLRETISVIPKDASVVATEGIGAQVSSRRYMYAMRRGLYGADYMLASRKELDYEKTRPFFTRAVKSGEYGVLKRVGEFVVLKKGHDTSGNAALIRDWKL